MGDCYIIVSGLPHEFADHAGEMASIGMAILDTVIKTKVSHMPADYVFKMRVGLNTGPVATGVVGLHAPRYCLFGETVTLAVIESTHSTCADDHCRTDGELQRPIAGAHQ